MHGVRVAPAYFLAVSADAGGARTSLADEAVEEVASLHVNELASLFHESHYARIEVLVFWVQRRGQSGGEEKRFHANGPILTRWWLPPERIADQKVVRM